MDSYGKDLLNFTQENPIIQRLSENGKKKILDLYEKELSQKNNYSELYEMVAEKKLQKQTYNDIFQSKTVRTVLTKGVAGVGKTFFSRMLMVDWAKGNSNQNIDLIVPLHFSELNERRNTDTNTALFYRSMKELLNDLSFLTEPQVEAICSHECKVAFVLDGLEECKLALDFKNNKKLTDTEETASMDELVTNLIKGDLLPTAHLWIISQPSAAEQLPDDCVDRRTGIQEKPIQRLSEIGKKKILDLYEKELSQENTYSELYEKVEKKKLGQKQTYNDIFQSKEKTVRTVLTKGVAGVGKTFYSRMLMVDWAKGNSNKNIDLIVPLHFSELNERINTDQSMEELLNDLSFLKDAQVKVICNHECKVAFVLDGLEECKLPLDFKKKKKLTGTEEAASTDEILTNLIKGDLLPNAHLWIISRPSRVKKIPPEYIKKKTKCRVSNFKQKLREGGAKRILDLHEKELRQKEKDSEIYEIEQNKEHEDKLAQTYNDMFQSKEKTVRTVLTKGVADVGKTFYSRMLMVDWAEGKSNKKIDLIVPIHFRELNERRDTVQSMEALLNDILNDIQQRDVCNYECTLAFVLDGLEECELPLDFENNRKLPDTEEAASMDELLTNLIKGDLLPNAQLWIISQPSGVAKIPQKHIEKVTECRESLKRRERLVSKLRQRFLREHTQDEDINRPNKKNTEHIMRENSDGNDEKKGQNMAKSVTQVNVSNIFKGEKEKTIRTVLTTGEADIGKSFHVEKFIKMWAENKMNKGSISTWFSSLFGGAKDDLEVVFPIKLSELNLIPQKKVSLVGLLNHLFEETKESVISNYGRFKVVFVLDGLDAFQHPLDFDNSDTLTDEREPASVDVILTNLIKGKLLPSAHVWITSRPSAAEQLPDDCVDKRTEIREKHIQKLSENGKKKILDLYEKELSQENTYSELYEMVKKKKPGQNQSYNDIFQSKKRTVLTKGVAGVGKTFYSRMLMVDWAKGNSNKNIALIVPLHFSELNKRNKSMEELLKDLSCLNDAQVKVICNRECKVAFILDGLEECKLPLDFKNNKELTDTEEAASMDKLLTNLIKGNLLPTAHLWIISQPSGVGKIPQDHIEKVTECRVYNFKQKLREGGKKRILVKYENELSQKEMDSEIYEIEQNKEHEDKLVQTYNDMFQSEKLTVLTKGVVGVGKTFYSRMLMVDWAKGKSNQNIDLIVPLHFRELNKRRNTVQSMEAMLNDILNDIQQRDVCNYECTLAFVLDGLEECELTLDFKNNKKLTDTEEAALMDELLTNLIKGDLLPTAHLWIISQPSGIGMIPQKHIEKVTECRESLKRREWLVSNLRQRFLREHTQVEDINHPNQKNTEHIMRENSDGNDEKKGQNMVKSVTQVNVSDIFKGEREKNIRTVLTTGEADVGKSFHVQKFMKMWAENKTDMRSMFTWAVDRAKSLVGGAKDDLEVVFPINFNKLNLMEQTKVSLVGLLNDLFKETKESVISNYGRFKVLFVLDGLDAFQHPLDFDHSDTVTDEREPASVDVILTNLIKGNLLPSAQVWITSRPSAAKQLPVDRRTEIREKPHITSQRKLKSQLKVQFTCVSEGIDRQSTTALLNEIYTDLYIIEGDRGEINNQHEFRQVQDAKFKSMRKETPIKYHDIFKPASKNNPIRTVLTIGVAGIGKTFVSMKYMLDWAEGTAVKNIYYTFSLPFRELNLRKEKEYSFEELLHQFFPAMEASEITDYDKYQILIVLDGLDECRLDLQFNESNKWTDVRKPTSVGVLLTNLIQGNLLPEAQIWITSRPAASNHIPPDKVDRVTEVRGFNDEQKEEYFRKRFSDKDLAEKILSHVKKSRSLYIMCHIPVFCWITSKVLEDFVKQNKEEGMPKTLTDMYIHFLLLQCRQANVKYSEDGTGETSETGPCWNTRNKETILSLGKLAFEELEKGNLLFTEDDLKAHSIDITNAAIFSGLFTQIKIESHGLYQQKLFCFVHLSIQEFLATFYVFHTFNNKGQNVLVKPTSVVSDVSASDFYKKAVDKALDNKNGDWDLFLRFLLGLSMETNQKLLQELLKKTENYQETYKETVEYIKKKINENMSAPDKNLNLFHCLNELHDDSLVNEVKKYLRLKTVPFEGFSASQWSALTFVLLTSDEKFGVFDLKKYLKSEKVLLGLLPLVKVSKTALLSWCELTEESCSGLTSSVLSSASSNLTELDLSHNDLLDSGVQRLADGLKNVQCKLEILKLSGCQVTSKGCSFLATALKSNAASCLKQLDLSYNHPGENGKAMLSAIAKNPNMKLKTLCFDHDGAHRLKPGLKKYCADLRLDERTAGKRLVLSKGNTVKTINKVQERVERCKNSDRFKRTQVFSDKGFKCLCYWEVEWEGAVGIAVAYRGVGRGWDSSGGLGCNDMSWSLICSEPKYTARHGNTSEDVKICQKIAVFLDWEGGTLSYYNVSSGKLSLIHTFRAKFTDRLFPSFWLKNGSVTLCDID